jgi:hypothetical protein
MELTKEMIECLNIRLHDIHKCLSCPKSETVARRKSDNYCLISVSCKEWLIEQENSLKDVQRLKRLERCPLTEEEELSMGIC